MIRWQDIDTVLLDMDGTLLDLHFDNHFWLDHLPRRYSELYDMDEEIAREQLVSRFQSERGTLNWYCLDYWSEQLQVDIVALKEEIQHLVAIRPHVPEFLHSLGQQGQRRLLVTNAHHDSVTLKMRNASLEPLVDEIISSHDYKLPKEDSDFWRHLANDHPFDPTRTLLIDDTETVLDSAHSFGIKHLITMAQPDSKRPHREQLRYPVIHHFDEIMPGPKGSGPAQ